MMDYSTLPATIMDHAVWILAAMSLPLFSMALADTGPAPRPLKHGVTPAYLRKNLRPAAPRLFLLPEYEDTLRRKTASDPVIGNTYQAIRNTVRHLTDKPVLTYEKQGRRLLHVSREMLERISCLGLVWRLEKDKAALDRMDAELNAVCGFPDWNPSHFLDVAEMSMAVALALDWTAGALPESTNAKARQALLDKAIAPGLEESGNWWISGTNNWNQVCHGGLTAAALVLANEYPDTAARIIARALDNLPYALQQYGPDGIYPEGPMYWSYGTSFTVLTIEMLRSALGTDFGIADYPAFKESARFRVLATAPSGDFYNFSDCGDGPPPSGDITLAWFAAETGDAAYFEKDKFLRTEHGPVERYIGPALVWMSRYQRSITGTQPAAWHGRGHTPLIVLRNTGADDTFYLGAKGGKATNSHGNMDAGSFIFELDGVRWSVDPGSQGYHDVEKTGFNLWSNCQECDRWKLLTKNNYGHSTLTVNGSPHRVDGYADITGFTDGEHPEAELDLTPVFGNDVHKAVRTFRKESGRAVVIEDAVTVNDSTRLLTWQMMTVADVEQVADGVLLRQDGKKLRLKVRTPENVEVDVVSLDPPPHELDKRIEGLKRIEIRVPVTKSDAGGKMTIRVLLKGTEQ